MNDESIKKLAEEIRRDFQIPPYFKDEGLVNYILEGEAELLTLVPYADIEEDKTYRMLLKNYVNYAYYHRVNDWYTNYAAMKLSWQLRKEVTT